MPNASAAVVDALIALYEAEQASIFRLMGEGSPYLAKAPPDVREAVADVSASLDRQGDALAATVRQLGGTPPTPLPPQTVEHQFIGLLSLPFLLPKLASEKKLCVQRFDNTLRAIGPSAPPEVSDLLKTFRAENQAHLATLQEKAEQVIAASR